MSRDNELAFSAWTTKTAVSSGALRAGQELGAKKPGPAPLFPLNVGPYKVN